MAFSVLKAEKIERSKRANVSAGLAGNPYTEWRDVKKVKLFF